METKISQKIDQEILAEVKKSRTNTPVKLLLLGSGESGKSTIVKQMKICFSNGYTDYERNNFKLIIFSNIHASTKCLVDAMDFLKIKLTPQNLEFYRTYNEHMTQTFSSDGIFVTPEIKTAVMSIWSDVNVKYVLESELYLPDSTLYYVENFDRIFTVNYIPDDQDILRSRNKTSGISESRFELPPLNIHLFDVGGQRSERKKWIHCFEGVACLVFVVAFSEYNQTLLEAPDVNRLDESIRLFDSVVNARWFVKSNVIFFMNKSDIFKQKLKIFPLERLYPDYQQGTDPSKAGKYILSKFVAVNRQKLKIYPHFTNAVDTSQIRVVFAAVKDTLVQQTLKGSGMF